MPGGGGGGSATVNVEPISKEAAECWGVEAVKEHNQAQSPVTTAMAALLGVIGTVGLFRQYAALDRSLDLAERGVAVAEDYYRLSLRNYEEIAIRAFDCQKEIFDEYTGQFQDFGRKFVECASTADYTCIEYAPDYALYEGRAIAGVGEQFSRMRARRQRQRQKYATGLCCHENLMLDISQAAATNEAINRGYRYEDQRRLQYDQWYWQRYVQAAEFVSNMRAHAISGVNGGVANATGALSGIGQAVGQIGSQTANQQRALENMASFWGSISNGAFGLMGSLMGFNSIGGGTQFNIPGMGPSAPQGMAQQPMLGSSPSPFSPGKFSPGMNAISDPIVVPGGPNIGHSINQGYSHGI